VCVFVCVCVCQGLTEISIHRTLFSACFQVTDRERDIDFRQTDRQTDRTDSVYVCARVKETERRI